MSSFCQTSYFASEVRFSWFLLLASGFRLVVPSFTIRLANVSFALITFYFTTPLKSTVAVFDGLKQLVKSQKYKLFNEPLCYQHNILDRNTVFCSHQARLSPCYTFGHQFPGFLVWCLSYRSLDFSAQIWERPLSTVLTDLLDFVCCSAEVASVDQYGTFRLQFWTDKFQLWELLHLLNNFNFLMT